MCIFCKIVAGEIPSYKVYEDDSCIAILDISQATKGHTIIIPKEHYDSIFDVKEEVYQHLMNVAHMLANHYKEVLPDMTGVNILNNNGSSAGQTVSHIHIHVIPRYDNDDVKMSFVDHNSTSNFVELLNELKLN